MADKNLTSSTDHCVYLTASVDENGIGQGDLARAIHNLYEAVYAICNNLDEDSGTLGTDYLAKIGTPLSNAMDTKIIKPSGKTTAA